MAERELRAQIAQVDKLIDANRNAVLLRVGHALRNCHNWQMAWDRNPDLHQRERELFAQRGALQQQAAELEFKEWQHEKRAKAAKARAERRAELARLFVRCDHCGNFYRQAA